RRAAIGWLVVASYIFYGWFDPSLAVLIAASTVFNFAVGSTIVASIERPRLARRLMWAGIGGDLALLCYFKYVDFFLANIAAIGGTSILPLGIALPIGISFYTFTQIA